MLALPGSVAQAQEQISPDDFLDRAMGRTLTFTDNRTGRVVGVEQFLRRDLSVWATSTGQCSYGRIELRGAQICFIYENFPNPENCWIPVNDQGELAVISTNNFEVQRITDVTDTPVECTNAPIS